MIFPRAKSTARLEVLNEFVVKVHVFLCLQQRVAVTNHTIATRMFHDVGGILFIEQASLIEFSDGACVFWQEFVLFNIVLEVNYDRSPAVISHGSFSNQEIKVEAAFAIPSRSMRLLKDMVGSHMFMSACLSQGIRTEPFRFSEVWECGRSP